MTPLEPLGTLASYGCNLWSNTMRYSYIGKKKLPEIVAHRSPRIFLFWHSQVLLMPFLLREFSGGNLSRWNTLVSSHRDGRLIGIVASKIGLKTIVCSPRGEASTHQLTEALQGGESLALPPDGPLGPARVVKSGIIRLAAKNGASIYPVAGAVSRSWKTRNWDHMIVPKPFSRACAAVGEPIQIPPDLSANDTRELQALVGDSINNLQSQLENQSLPDQRFI